VIEMRTNNWEETSSSGLKIGLALLPALLGPFAALNFWWAVRIVAALRRGENVLARWRVSGDALTSFIEQDHARSTHGPAYRNDWTPPSEPPADGIEIVFGAMGVLVNDHYFTLYKSGLYKFSAVGVLPAHPLCIEFVTATTMVSNISTVIVRRFTAVLRLPVTSPESPEVLKVLDHYRKVLSGETDPNPGFYQQRIRVGLTGAVLFLVPAFIGYLIGPQSDDYFDVASLAMVFGGIFGFGSLLLAALAWLLLQRQRQLGAG
jgi:hypothetical protein